MAIKKRQIITAALLLALGSAVFLNWHYSKPEKKSVSSDAQTNVNLGDAQFVNADKNKKDKKDDKKIPKDDFFAGTKIKRQAAHDEAREMLQKVIESENADKKEKDTAAKNLAALANAIKLETDTEALIKAKINGECAVLINNNEAQVIVEKGKLSDNTIIKIQEIVIGQTGFSSENITIIELNS